MVFLYFSFVYFFVLLDIMFFLMFNCVFLSALLYVLLPSGVINHVCMYVLLNSSNSGINDHLFQQKGKGSGLEEGRGMFTLRN